MAGGSAVERMIDHTTTQRSIASIGCLAVTLWSYYEPGPSRELPPAGYAHALERLHADMRKIDVTTPHFMDRVADTQQGVASRDVTPELADADRELLGSTLRRLRRAIGDRGAAVFGRT